MGCTEDLLPRGKLFWEHKSFEDLGIVDMGSFREVFHGSIVGTLPIDCGDM